jgi:hypothetical protein
MSLLDEQLKVAQEKGLLVNIYRDHHDDSPRLCRINAVSEYCIYATCFNDDGEYDGVTICRKDHVTRIRWGGTDRESQRRLVERSRSIPAAPEVNLATLKDIMRVSKSSSDTLRLRRRLSIGIRSILAKWFLWMRATLF